MTRTRLDEIVEEVLNDYPTAAGYTAGGKMRAVAERAFRHGVEQAWADCKRMIDVEVPSTDSLIYKYSHKTSVEAVQPAPAGEKCSRYGGSFDSPHCADRRKASDRRRS